MIRRFKPRRILSFLLSVLIFISFAFYYYNTNKINHTHKPTITIDDITKNKFNVTATEKDFLKNVTARDKEDGNITSQIIIEPLSGFVDKNKRIVTYVVCDSDNNVTKLEREIEYTNYVPPVISPVKELVIHSTKIADVIKCFKAYDVIDGDISDKLKIEESDNTTLFKGYANVVLTVTNSCGDTTTLPAKITVA
ncbi:hypothetical protein AGMMS50284_0660 [Clostridia bacterium]|nr:hypothetical protein AGMMS50284_0660 [Clostridia bacterium]